MMITKKASDGKKKECHQGLLDMVFSWPIKDVLNKNLYTNKVQQIPDIFPSTTNYLNTFKVPLIEETRAEFCSGLESVGNAPACEISGIWLSKNHRRGTKNLYYDIITKNISDPDNQSILYEPETGDVFAITDRRPRNIGVLIKLDRLLHLGYVSSRVEDEPMFEILSSEKLDREQLKNNGRLFVTYLMNLTTNMRIWTALHGDPKSNRFGLLQKVLQHNSDVDEGCSLCTSEEKLDVKETYTSLISRFGLDESQREAILSSVCLRKCSHNYNLKMIWGPPGTGKTKTVASMLFVLLKLNFCRALTCAPTNIAVIQVAKRLVTLFLESTGYDTYGLGDIILYGNGKRMKIDDHCELVDVFLKYRVDIITECLSKLTGWKHSLESMIALLENPRARYNAAVVKDEGTENDKEAAKDKNESDVSNEVKVEKGRRITTAKRWKEVINKSLKENKKQNKSKGQRNGQHKHLDKDVKAREVEETKKEETMTFEEFMRKNFCSLANKLVFCAENLYTHLPTSILPLPVAKQMMKLVDILRTLLYKEKLIASEFTELIMKRKKEILLILKVFLCHYPEPKISGRIRNFCLDNARLVFCTASGAIKVNSNVDMVIIDEAAQLKECESTIPLQKTGLRTAILIGDDRQLPAMVRSEVLNKMNFGRSLFQRLSGLGKKKHLLNIQYRMHPSISLFPNREFYKNKIVDAPNVKERSYAKKFLEGDMYGSYSFINVSGGKESFKEGHSPRNFEEATIVDRIIAKLFKNYYCTTKQKVSVGVISPYKGQVGLLQEKLEKKYITHKEKFCINIRSVDGFQGGEEDIIIISTVRCNFGGSVGFLSNCQRTNVALTRARYCLWIVGSASTFGNSRSVWNNIIHDAKTRGCVHDADDDIDLNHATSASKCDFFGHLKLDKAKWKIIFSAEFKVSISRMSVKTQIQVKKLLHKIAGGWRQPNVEKPMIVAIGDSIAYELLEKYKVDETLQLAWSVEIVKEHSKYIQVIKVWDILPNSKIPNLVKNVAGILFGRYNVDFMNRCNSKHFEGNLVVPMSWPAQSFHMAPLRRGHAESCLSNQLAAMNLGHSRK